MRTSKTYFGAYSGVLAMVCLLGACVAAGCTVGTDDDDDDGFLGEAGESENAGASPAAGSGGASAGAGGATAGTGGTNGGASGALFECDGERTRGGSAGAATMGSCATAAGDDDCLKCLKTKCCGELSTCNAMSPGNQCGLGGPNGVGEFNCYQSCLRNDFAMNGSIDDSDRETCASECVTSKDNMGALDCGPVVGSATNDLVACVMENSCNAACYGS